MNSNTAAFIIFLSLLDTQPFEVGARTRNSEMYILHTLIHYNKISFHINSILLLIQLHLYLYDLFTAYIKGGGALCAGNAVALLVFGPVMP